MHKKRLAGLFHSEGGKPIDIIFMFVDKNKSFICLSAIIHRFVK